MTPKARTRRAWNTVGVIGAAVLAIAGLFIIFFMIMAAIALNSFGSNK